MELLRFPSQPAVSLADEAQQFADKCRTDYTDMRTAIVILEGKGLHMVCLGEAPDLLHVIGLLEICKASQAYQILPPE